MIRKGVYSLWTKPMDGIYNGFRTKEDFLNSLHLSVHCSKKWFDEVIMVTDNKGMEIINNTEIKFDSISNELENINYDKKHWAIGKIITASLQKEPFMHIDHDVFWFKKPPEYLLKADASFQNKEYEYPCYNTLLEISKKLDMKNGIDYNKNIAYNCGIFGFNKLDIIKEWLELADTFIKNIDNSSYDIEHEVSSILFEQHHIYQLIEKYNYNVELVGETHVSNERAKELGYTHIISGSKRTDRIEEKVRKKLAHTIGYSYN